MLLFTILVAKSKGVRLIMSSSPHMYLFGILLYSVLYWVIVIELLQGLCCVLYNLNRLVLLREIESLPYRSKVNAGTLPFIPLELRKCTQ